MEQIAVHHENKVLNGASTHLSAHMLNTTTTFLTVSPGGGGTPYNGLYGEAPPERGTFFRLQV